MIHHQLKFELYRSTMRPAITYGSDPERRAVPAVVREEFFGAFGEEDSITSFTRSLV